MAGQGSIKGIIVEIGGDTTPLNKALAGANKTSQDLQSELRQVEKLLKLDPTNTELLAQKQKLLAEAISNTKTKLETLKTAQEQAQQQMERGDISAEQYRALQREIISTEQALANLEAKAISANEKITESTDKASLTSKAFWEELEEISQTSKSLQNELGQTNELLKLDPANTELLAEKQALLADSIENTKSKLEALKEAQAQAQAQDKMDSGEITAEQYRAAQREIISTEQALADLEAQAASTNEQIIQSTDKSRLAYKAFREELKKSEKTSEGLQSELEKVNELLKLDPTNTELISQKQQILAKDVENTKDKLEMLKTAQEQAQQQMERGDISAEQYRALQREIIETEQNLKKLEAQAQSSNGKINESTGKAVDGSKEYKKEMELLNAQHDRAIAKLGNEATATQKLSAQKTHLKDQIKLQKTETNRLQAELDELTKAENQNEDAIREKRTELEKAETKLLDYRNEIEEVNKSLEGNSAGFKDFGEKASEMGGELQPLSVAAAGLGGGMIALAVKAGQSADEINTLAKQTGLTTEEIQKFQYASELVDVPLDTLTGSMAKLTKNMATAQKGTGDASKAFKTLKVDIVDNQGALRSNQDVFTETIQKLGEMENETQRDALAMQIFGKSAQDLNPLILGGADALKTLGDEAEQAGLILSQDMLDAANALNDEIDTLKADSSKAFIALGTDIGITLLPMFKELVEWFKQGIEYISGLDKGTLAMIVSIAGIVAALAPLLMIIGSVSTGLSALGGVLSFLSANPIVLIIAAIAALVLIFANLWDTSEGFRNFFIKMGEDITKSFQAVGDFFVTLFTKTIPGALEKMQSFFEDVFEGLINIVKAPINLIIQLFNGLLSGINLIIQGINSIKIDIPDWLPDWLGGGQKIGFNIPELSTIPMLAGGGRLAEGEAIIAEAGPEMLRIKNGVAEVTPLSSSARNQSLQQAQSSSATINNYNTFKVENIEDYVRIKNELNNEKRYIRMGYGKGR